MFERNTIPRIGYGVSVLLCLVLVGDLVGAGWNWGVFDYILAFILLFSTGLAFEHVLRYRTLHHRIVAGVAIILSLLLVWVELATGGISKYLHEIIAARIS